MPVSIRALVLFFFSASTLAKYNGVRASVFCIRVFPLSCLPIVAATELPFAFVYAASSPSLPPSISSKTLLRTFKSMELALRVVIVTACSAG